MPHPLRSLRNRLTLIFALIVAGAIGIVYFYVTPRLEDELRDAEARARSPRRRRPTSARCARLVGDPTSPATSSSGRRERGHARRAPRSTTLQVSRDLEQLSRVAVSNPGGVPLDVDELADRAIRVAARR